MRRVFTHSSRLRGVRLSAVMFLALGAGVPAWAAETKGERTSRISDDAVPLIDTENFPQRPKPLLELGNPFLGTGNISRGIEMPGGAVWQPSLLLFGTYRTAAQAFHNGNVTNSEWANRLDIFANLQLSGTERVLLGMRPLDKNGMFTGRYWEPNAEWHEEFNAEITTLFFEGDFGEIFPNLDPHDFGQLDYGFSVGRQPISMQDGILINDDLDAIGVTRNSILPKGGTNLQLNFLYAWNNIHRDDNREYSAQHLYALSAIADYRKTTVSGDVVYVDDCEGDTDGMFWGLGGVQRIGHYNTTFRVAGSHALEQESAIVSDGVLLFSEISWTPPWTHDLVYINGFAGFDEFSSASRAPDAGGPLGRTGILFAAIGLGRYGAPLGNRADEAVGGAVGYQWFLDEDKRKQLVFEVGGRKGTGDGAAGDGAAGIGARYQQAFGRRFVLQFDVFGALQESRDEAYGGRTELRMDF